MLYVSSMSDIVEPFLKKYQTDKPMILFVYEDLEDLGLLELFIKPAVLERNMTEENEKLDLYDKENLFNVEIMIVGFAVEDEIHNLKKKDLVTASQIKMFMKNVQGFLSTIVNKLFEISPGESAGPVLEFTVRVEYVQKGHPTLVTQVDLIL